jgi:hypothetical protein
VSEPETPAAGPVTRTLYRKALLAGDPSHIQLRFNVAVLDAYRKRKLSIKRTRTVGRVSAASWTLNFGIAPGDATIHASMGDLTRLPEAEREHWCQHLAEPGLSEHYLAMLLHPGSCIDDGDTTDW